ncbi:MAG: o-succinylbenzoate synthase [Candidatus Planktophila sp.]
MFDQLLSTLRVVALPMKTNFRGVTVREVALFQGEYGWGEFSPFLEYDDQESSRWLAAAVEAATQPRPQRYRESIPVNGTIPAISDGNRLKEIIESYPGCATFKVKVGENLNEDLIRLQLLRTLRPSAAIRLDVNGLWSVADALKNLSTINDEIGEIQYVEQPCATVEELRELKSRADFNLKIAADEVIRKALNPFAVDLNGAADYVMLKVQPLGGITRSIEIATHHELPVVVSSALESAVGINYGLELAASIKDLSFDCGLATGSLISKDVDSLPITNGSIALKSLEVNLDGLEVAPDRFEWWKNRAMRCAKELGL